GCGHAQRSYPSAGPPSMERLGDRHPFIGHEHAAFERQTVDTVGGLEHTLDPLVRTELDRPMDVHRVVDAHAAHRRIDATERRRRKPVTDHRQPRGIDPTRLEWPYVAGDACRAA